jgi:hypothetical protein
MQLVEVSQDEKYRELVNGLVQVLDRYHVMLHQIKRVQTLCNRLDDMGLHDTAEQIREALAGEIGA